jgi:peptidoglycan/LPS O-acetylase OafA/YrhL
MTLLHRTLFLVPFFLMLLIYEVFGLDGQSDIALFLFIVAIFISFLILAFINWRLFAGYSRTKRWERISRKRASAEASINEARS